MRLRNERAQLLFLLVRAVISIINMEQHKHAAPHCKPIRKHTSVAAACVLTTVVTIGVDIVVPN